MPVTRVPIATLPQPPLEFQTFDEVNSYLRDLHRELENYFSSIDTVISENYEDVDGGSA